MRPLSALITGMLTAALYAAVFVAPAHAVGTITAVEPASVLQGDTVLLTIRGSELPQGSTVLEFYPQQIAVLSLLSIRPDEIQAQVKVPNLAEPGLYNILIYNQSGDEAFAKGLLTVASNVLTPVFNGYDPKMIAQVDSGFALLMSCDAVSQEAIGHLSMSWESNGERLSGIRSSFTLLDSTTVVCAISGQPPGGLLRGTVKMDDRPIYLVDVEVMSERGTIVGNAPATLSAAEPPYVFTLLGAQFSPGYVTRLKVKLIVNGQPIEAAKVLLRDEATIAVEFDRALPLGSLALVVEEDGVVVYEGQLGVTDAPAPAPERPQVDTETIESIDASPEPIVGGDPFELIQMPDAPELPEALPGDSTPPAAQTLSVAGMSPEDFMPGVATQKYTVSFTGEPAGMEARLEPTLLVDGIAATVEFKGATGRTLTCVFGIPLTGAAVQTVQFELSDPAGEFPTYSRELTVLTTAPVDAVPDVSLAPLSLKLQLASNKIEIDNDGFRIDLLGAAELTDPSLLGDVELHAELLLLERNMDKFKVGVLEPQTGGDPITTLLFRRDPELLSDELYALFVEQLRAEDEVLIRLNWTLLSTQIVESATFVSSEELVFADLMQGL